MDDVQDAKILFLNHAAEMGGAEYSLLDVARSLSHRCKVVLFSDGNFRQALERNGIEAEIVYAPSRVLRVRRTGGPWSMVRAIASTVMLSFKVSKIARDSDVVYANSQKALVVACLVKFLARKPLLWHQRDILSSEHFGPVQRLIVRTLSNMIVDRIIVNSDATRSSMTESGVKPQKLTRIYNGVGSPHYSQEYDSAATRAALAGASKNVVGCFSRIASWKGQHILIEALKDQSEVTIILVGGPLFGEARYQRYLETLVERYNMAHRVQFLGNRSDVSELMRSCDVVVHTSVAPEPFGRVIVEAMLARSAVVAGRSGGVEEIVRHGVDGLLVTPGDPAEMQAAVGNCISDPQESIVRIESAYNRAREEFSVERMQEAVRREIESLLEAEGRKK